MSQTSAESVPNDANAGPLSPNASAAGQTTAPADDQTLPPTAAVDTSAAVRRVAHIRHSDADRGHSHPPPTPTQSADVRSDRSFGRRQQQQVGPLEAIWSRTPSVASGRRRRQECGQQSSAVEL